MDMFLPIAQLYIYIGVIICIMATTSKATVFLYETEIADYFEQDIPEDATQPDNVIEDSTENDCETAPGLFQGDIAMDSEPDVFLRLGVNPIKHTKRLWPNRTIPYEISSKYTKDERLAVESVLRVLNSLTCIRFIPYDGVAKDYLIITPPKDGPKGCWSYVGRRGGPQTVSLQRPDMNSLHCFSSEGRIMHELMHAIGIYHEQSRADRDKYVKIHWDNIMPKFKKNFKLVSQTNGKYSFDYDYNSVMHYGTYYFSKTKGTKPTITPLQPGIKIGQRRTLSKTDCLKINELYGCLTGRHVKMYRSFCKLLGL